MKGRTIGVEIEFTGITREQAASVVGKFFDRTAQHKGGGYDVWTVLENNRIWQVMRDGSIKATNDSERCELVTPILNYGDIETLQEIVRELRAAGAKVNDSCGMHVHIGAAGLTAQTIRNLINNVASHEELLYKALTVHEKRRSYCKPTDERFLQELNAKKPATLEELKAIWYDGRDCSHVRYHVTRYTICNLHALFTKGTIEFRIFNGTMHAGEVKAAIQFCCALVANAASAKKISYKATSTENAKFAMRTWLTRPTGLNLNGDEFKTLRHHFTKNLDGNAAWRFAI